MAGGLLGNSSVPNYVKLCATGILTTTYLAALLIGVDVYVTQGPNGQVPTMVSIIIGSGLTMAINALGLHQGASLSETPPTGPQLPGTTTTTVTTNTGGDNASA